MTLPVRPLTAADLPAVNAHFARHRAESGRDGMHFMPFAPADPDGPRGLAPGALELPLSEPGWQRWFVASAGSDVVAHVNLKASELRTQLHRCELGIGIEQAYRGRGLGRELMQTAIDFCRGQASLHWLDLRVFGHNRRARALYKVLGFRELGVIEDCFRIDGQRVDDVLMTLEVSGSE